MDCDDEPVGTAVSHVMLRHQCGHRADQLVGECVPGGGAGEPDLGVERERHDLFAAARERADLADDPRVR